MASVMNAKELKLSLRFKEAEHEIDRLLKENRDLISALDSKEQLSIRYINRNNSLWGALSQLPGGLEKARSLK